MMESKRDRISIPFDKYIQYFTNSSPQANPTLFFMLYALFFNAIR